MFHVWHPLTQLIFQFFKFHEKLIWSLLSQQICASCTGKITCNIGDASWVAKPVNHRVNMMGSNTWWKHPFSSLLEIHDLIQAFFNLFCLGISSRFIIKKRIASAFFPRSILFTMLDYNLQPAQHFVFVTKVARKMWRVTWPHAIRENFLRHKLHNKKLSV